jgi:hypothetical protein
MGNGDQLDEAGPDIRATVVFLRLKRLMTRPTVLVRGMERDGYAKAFQLFVKL